MNNLFRNRNLIQVEGYNSLFRHFLAQLRRKSKSKGTLKYSVMLLMLKLNGELKATLD